MASVRAWPRREAAGCWRRAVRRAASACLPELFRLHPRGPRKLGAAGEKHDSRPCKAQDPRRFSPCCRRTPPSRAAGLYCASRAAADEGCERHQCQSWFYGKPQGRQCGGTQSRKAAAARNRRGGIAANGPSRDGLCAGCPGYRERAALRRTFRRPRRRVAAARAADGERRVIGAGESRRGDVRCSCAPARAGCLAWRSI